MKNPFIVILGIVLLLGAGVLVWRVEEEAAGTGATRADGARATGGDSKGHVVRGVHGGIHVIDRLRELTQAEASAAPGFEQIEKLVSQLSETEMDFWGMRQAWFSTFRGWAEVDVVAAAGNLLKFIGPLNQTAQVTKPLRDLSFDSYERLIRQDDVWKRRALQEVFAQFAPHDPEAAWAALPAEAGGGFRESALEGFIAGLKGDARLPEFMDRWLAQRRKRSSEITLEIEPSVGSNDYVIDLRFAPPVDGSPDPAPNINFGALWERSQDRDIAARAALSLAATDRSAAVEWLQNAEVPGGELDFYELLAREEPRQALELIRSDSVGKPPLVMGLISEHPALLRELLAEVKEPDSRAGHLESALQFQASLPLAALFPAPGRTNRLPDYEERYRTLVEAVNGGGFPVENERSLLQAIHREFAHVVPEAQAAALPVVVPIPVPVPQP